MCLSGSVRDYYCYKFQIRPGIFNPIFFGKRLFQQFAIDTYVKIESSRLDYIRNNQDSLRADLYLGLVDSLNAGEGRADAKGRSSCKNHYPRPFAESTSQGKDSYPIYRRCDNGCKEKV